MKVLFLSYIPSPYRVAFFNELGKQCELTVVFEKAVNAIRDDSWKDFSFDNFRGIILKGKGNSGASSLVVIIILLCFFSSGRKILLTL